MCSQVTGTANVMMTVWLREIGELPAFEQELEERVPGMVVLDRSLTLGTPKRLGSLLDPEGRRTGSVPVPLLDPS